MYLQLPLSELSYCSIDFSNILLETEVSKYLTEADYERAAKDLGVEVAMIKAVVDVEAVGRGFLCHQCGISCRAFAFGLSTSHH